MKRSKATPVFPIPPRAAPAQYSQAEIDNCAMRLYLERYDLRPFEMGAKYAQATRFYNECLKQVTVEMGPAIDFSCGGEMTHPEIDPAVQAVIDRMALLKPNALERAKSYYLRGNYRC